MNESKNETTFFQKEENKNINKINKTDESSTIYNDDSYNEIQIILFPIQIFIDENLLNSNLYSAITTSNTNPHLIITS